MSKLKKNILLSILTAIAFAFAGLFFVGCNAVDYSNVTISTSVPSVDLEVGETRDIDFTIENASSSFYRVLRFSVDNESVVNITNVSYNENVATVTVAGLEGGSVNLMATSEEGYKWTTIRLNVVEHSSTMEFNNSQLYLTTGNENFPATSLNLNSGYYNFDANATDKDMSFYYLYFDGNVSGVDISSMNFDSFIEAEFDFSDVNNIITPNNATLRFIGERTRIELEALKFDNAEIVNDVLYLYNNGVVVANSDEESALYLDSLTDALINDSFDIIAFYNYSIYENAELGTTNYLHQLHKVSIYQNLGVTAYGGYVKTEIGENEIETKSVDLSTQIDLDDVLKIVPNNSQFDAYVIKLVTDINLSNLEFGVSNVGNNLSLETYDQEAWDSLEIDDGEGDADNAFYIIIRTSSFSSDIQNFSLYVRYEGMEEVNDYNVNYNPTAQVEIDLVATDILLNNVSASSYSSEENPIYIYNFYRFPEFGWMELDVSLSSGLDAEPTFSYATINFDSQIIDFRQGTNGEVVSDRQITDLETNFFYRGRTDANESDGNYFTITIYYLVSGDEANSENVISISCQVYFDIIAGASEITRNQSYGNGEMIFIDRQAEGMVSLGDYLYTESRFQEVTVRHMSGTNVVSFVVDEECCKERRDENGDTLYYALNLYVNPLTTGTGMYQVMLDNGVFVSVTISVIDTLQTDDFGVELLSSDHVGYYEYKSTNFAEDAEDVYTNTLFLEILNPTSSDDDSHTVIYGSEVRLGFYGNIESIEEPDVDNGNVISVGSDGTFSYVISTNENGEAHITFTVEGNGVSGSLNRSTVSVEYYVEVVSYSLLDEFYLMNGGSFAVDNVVYYGQSVNLPTESTSVTFDVHAENQEAFGFYKYKISDSFFDDLMNEIIVDEELSTTNEIAGLIEELIGAMTAGVTEDIVSNTPITLSVDDSYIVSELEYSPYSRDFIYFYADANSKALTTSAVAVITISSASGLTSTYPLYLEFGNGIMFDIVDVSTTCNFNNIDFNINIDFTNEYMLAGASGIQGRFDLNTFTYTHIASTSGDFVLHSYIRQRNYTEMQYNANIITSEYIQVERVSTASSIDEFAFTNGYFSDSVIVFVNPTNATNIELNAQFVADNATSRGLVTTNIIEQSLGVYLIEISVEDFYNANSNIINTIETALGGTLYIYPVEWGEDYSVLGEHTPIRIDISYRNGTEANRYIIDSPEDVLAINNNEETLSSHYEIRTNIDMSTVKSETLGFVNTASGKQLVGFSGSIVGTTSQAGISNFNITLTSVDEAENGNITAIASGTTYYAGLFAQINYDGYIKNLTVSGTINLNTTNLPNSNFYAGLLAGVNYGKLSNVGAEITGASEILICNSGEYAIGGLVGSNAVYTYSVDGNTNDYAVGEIVQNFNSYVEKTEEESAYYTIEDKVGEFEGQSPRNLAYFNAKLSIVIDGTGVNSSVYAGGIAGISYGDIYRIDNSDLSVYGYASYSSYINIEISGSSANRLFAGGAVGYFQGDANISSNIIRQLDDAGDEENFYVNDNPIDYTSNEIPRATIYNLLVGGEVDVQSDATTSAVGGIVGYAGAGENNIYILGNISRTFVRGQLYVGGILGIELNTNVNYLLYETDESGSFETQDGGRVILANTINAIEAVDDGRGAFDSSMMLLRGTTVKLTEDNINESDGVTEEVIVAIGNSFDNGRSYISSGVTTALFEVCSYVSRNRNGDTGEEINQSDTSTSSYYGDYLVYNGNTIVEQFVFTKQAVNLGLQESMFAMTSENGEENVFLMFYFSGMLTEDADGVAQDYIEDTSINRFSPNSSLYPFALNTRDAQILSTSTNLLRVDADGSLTTYSNGTAIVSLQSILNVQTSINIYLYIVNYLDIQSENSIFYSSNTTNSLNLIDGSQVVVYGTRQTSIYAVPTYSLSSGNLSYEMSNGERRDVVINSDGTFLLNNVSIRLNQNDSVVVDATCENPLYTTYQVSGQSILFYGNGDNLQGTDTYSLTSYLETEVGGNVYRLPIGASKNNADVEIDVEYRETATAINVSSNLISMRTNDTYTEKINVTSRNDEFVYYEIYYTDDNNNEHLIQQRMSTDWIINLEEDAYLAQYQSYMLNSNSDLFNLKINKVLNNNEMTFELSVNKTSARYLNRANADIYGEYRIVFYANELFNGVHTNFVFFLSEAEITNVEAVNYSNIRDISVRDETIVPSQYGILEISIDPVDAEFNTFTIRNNSINYSEGTGEVDFTFVYQSTTNGVVSFVPDVNFGSNYGGSLSFTYDDYVDYLENHGESYNGKIYIRYLLGSLGVQDEMPIRFDIEVSYLSGQVEYEEVNLTTKLANYAHLSFDDREESDVYYVARGLDYGMTLDYYGFGLEDIDITISSDVATLVGNGTAYTLEITDNVITPNDDIGYRFYIYVNASRVVDNVTVQYSEILTVYIMEFVFDYQYIQGQYEDIVRGMEEGVISTAVGNAYTLEVDIWDFIEYDTSNNSVVRNVQEFINSLTNNATFRIYDSSTGRDGLVLNANTDIRSDYYYIHGLVFTGIRLYEPEQDIYHFSMEANFVRRNGLYVVDTAGALDSQRIYTEFSFSIHQQSTNESPLPIETYEELMDMEDGQYYILLNDIILPNNDSINPFTPITANVAGFDGNGYSLLFGGNYTFDGSSVGVFETIGVNDDNVVVRNLTVELYSNTIFTLTSSSFNLGLIAGTNSGVITNCSVVANNNSALSVSCVSSGSYVAGMVGRNSGIITNSRSSVSIFTNVNLAGFVGNNSGTISSSYFYGGALRNETTTTTEYTAGFVVTNSGEINTSYVSGEVNDGENVYSRDSESFITSHNAISGFVFINSGEISNSYSNIYMNNTSSYASGFVFSNQSGGSVSSSFSTSVLTSNSTLSYGFARANSGTIQDAYYLSDSEENVNVSIATIDNNANTSIEPLTIEDFNITDEDFAEHFQNFVYSSDRGYNAVWFYNNTNTSAYYDGQNFNLNRLELVAPNIIAFSQRYLYSAEEVVDAETGVSMVIYHYLNTAESGESGSITNPILLDNAENFENYILNENDNNNYNHAYYRLINNIDYSDYDDNSELFRTRFMGYLEGNFLTISNVRMVTSERLTYAGFFAEIGSSTRQDAIGTVMNFNLEPAEMVFTNTQVSGGITGRLDGGIITNVNLLGDSDVMISANNISGGLVGIAVGYYDIENVSSYASARATYIPSSSSANFFNENSSDFSSSSYAGAIVGVAGGSGIVNKASVSSAVSVIGSTAGGLIGMVGREARASNLTLTVDEDFMINAYFYGGLVIGESAGRISSVDVIGTGLYETIFNNIPNYPTAVGGVVGLMSSGEINDVSANQSLNLSSSTNTSGVSYLGGLIGTVSGSVTITNIDIQGSYIGFSSVGGIVGGVTGINNVVNMRNINYTNGYLSVLSTQQSQASIGGMIGSATDTSSINITADLTESLKNSINNYYESLRNSGTDDSSYLEFTQAIDAEEYVLSTDIYTSDDRSVINSQYLSEANNVQFDAYVLAYTYGTILDVYLGEIVGYTLSNMVSVNNTVSAYTANVLSYNMGWSSPEEFTESAYISNSSYNYNLITSSGILPGSGTMFVNELNFTETSAETDRGHIVQTTNSFYSPSTATLDIDGETVITTVSFGTNLRADGSMDTDNFYILPIYSHDVTYTFYMENGESEHTLYLTDFGMGVSRDFTSL